MSHLPSSAWVLAVVAIVIILFPPFGVLAGWKGQMV